ncbi:hypothetical protein [Salipiger aestuarii]|uniref:hypothetical protein n=1 Tax=Salipiger aestuarii TaxID=568098 RepID=UPI0016808CD7|nr:hypothetical protein [Salipiger aestuarii]
MLRPSLRAAIHLERLHGGLPELLRKVEDFDTRTIWQVITAAAGHEAATSLAAEAADRPLADLQAAALPACFDLVAALIPEAAEDKTAEATSALSWTEFFKQLYGYATGWMNWTPDAALRASPQEIAGAFNAFAEYHKAINGSPETKESTGPSEAQRRENEALGLDPEFDREGLRRLKTMSQQREGQTV